MQDPAMQEKHLDQTIMIGKPPASTTEITQTCDARHCFINSKTAVKKINDCALVGKNWMRNSFGNIFKEHEYEYKYDVLPVHQKNYLPTAYYKCN